MLVLQPRMSTVTDLTGVVVDVFVGRIVTSVAVDEGVSVFDRVTVTGVITTTPGVAVSVKGRVMIIGVAVTTPGVREGIGVQTGNG